ncbi:membrane-associated protein, putative, partial [Bodo saltans]
MRHRARAKCAPNPSPRVRQVFFFPFVLAALLTGTGCPPPQKKKKRGLRKSLLFVAVRAPSVRRMRRRACARCAPNASQSVRQVCAECVRRIRHRACARCEPNASQSVRQVRAESVTARAPGVRRMRHPAAAPPAVPPVSPPPSPVITAADVEPSL